MCEQYSQNPGTISANVVYARRKQDSVKYQKYLKKERKRRRSYLKKNPKLAASFYCQITISSLFQRLRRSAKKGAKYIPMDGAGNPARHQFTFIKISGLNASDWIKEIEAKLESGMDWANYGRGGWRIEYLKKPSSFNLLDPQERLKAFNPSNCKPCWYAKVPRYLVELEKAKK